MNPIAIAERKLAGYSSIGLLALRIAVGVVFIAHGYQKLFVYGIAGVAGNFEKIGIPLPYINAILATAAEFGGGILVLAGLATRLAAIPIAFTMIVAFATVHGSKGFFLPEGYEYVFVLFLASVAILFLGPGKYSVDAALLGRGGTAEGADRS